MHLMIWMAAKSAAEHQYQYIYNSMGVMQDWGDPQAALLYAISNHLGNVISYSWGNP